MAAFNVRPFYTSFHFLWYFFLVVIAFISFPIFSAAATQVTLSWDKNSEPDVAGYSLFSRQTGETYNYNSPEWEGNDTSCTIYNLIDTVGYCFVVRAYDTDGNESEDSNELCITNASTNQGPIADAGDDQNIESGAMVSLNGSNSVDFDDGIASFLWKQVDGPTVNLNDPLKPEATFRAPNVGPGGVNLTFVLTVTDFGGIQGTDTCTVFVKAKVNDQLDTSSSVHVGDIEGTGFNSRRNKWKASVDVVVHDNNCDLVDGATVSGVWSGGYTGIGFCITQNGKCSVTSGDINTRKSKTSFTIESISSPGLAYDPIENHDLDEDSDGSSITVLRP